MSSPAAVTNTTLLWLTGQFVEPLLRRRGNDATLRVRRVDVASVHGVGNTVRVSVEYTRQEGRKRVSKTCSLIVKLSYAAGVDFFLRELHMYDVTLPRMYKCATDKTTDINEHLRPTCNFYKTDRTDVIILEDLSASGFKMADPLKGLDLQHSLLAIKALARLHASSMVLLAKDPTSMDFYDIISEDKPRGIVKVDVKTTLSTLATEVESWVGFERFGEKLKNYASVYSEMEKCEEGDLNVLSHGFFCTSSLMFRYENGEAVDVKIIKLQYVNVMSPAYDILHFIYSSLSQDVLENHRDQIVREYVASLKETLRFLEDERVLSEEDISKELESLAHCTVNLAWCVCANVAIPWDYPDLPRSADELQIIFSGRVFRKLFETRLREMEKRGVL